MSRSLYDPPALPRASWISRNGTWVIIAIFPTSIAIGLALGVVLNRGDDKLRPACDRVVERFLTTKDPVELERSRFLIERLECSVSERVKKWPADRTGVLNEAAVKQ